MDAGESDAAGIAGELNVPGWWCARRRRSRWRSPRRAGRWRAGFLRELLRARRTACGADVRGPARGDARRGSTAQMRAAPAARKAAMVNSPMGPAPMTATVSPARMEARRSECIAMARGSARAASSNDMSVRDGREVGGGQVDELAKEAGMVRVGEKANVGADVVMAAQAELAVIAVEGRLKRAAIACSKTGDAGAGL